MAFDTVPWIIDGTTIDAETIRRALGTLIGPAGGIVTPGDLAVTAQATPNMSVAIGPGQIWVPGSSTPTQGPYYGHNGAAVTQPITASNPSLPRVDTITVQVQDQVYAGSLKQLAPGYVLGTPTSGANIATQAAAASYAGALPASSYVLAYVLVPAAATSITTGDILKRGERRGAAATEQRLASGQHHRLLRDTRLCQSWRNDHAPGGRRCRRPDRRGHGLAVRDGATPVTVSSAYGIGFLASPFLLGTPLASVILMSDGANWVVISGQQDTGWVNLGGSSLRRVVGDQAYGSLPVYFPAYAYGTGLINIPHGLAETPTWCSAAIGSNGFPTSTAITARMDPAGANLALYLQSTVQYTGVSVPVYWSAR